MPRPTTRPANPTPGTRAEQVEAYRELCRYHTHDALGGPEAMHIAAPFGLYHNAYEVRCNTGDFKGLHIAGLPRNAKVRRIGMFDLAEDIARHLGLTYPSKLGRGSQARECLVAIAKHLGLAE